MLIINGKIFEYLEIFKDKYSNVELNMLFIQITHLINYTKN